MSKPTQLSSGAALVLFGMMLASCSSPSDPSTPLSATDSGAVSSDTADTHDTSVSPDIPDALPDSGDEISNDADVSVETKPGCKQGDICTTLGEWCGTLLCTECGTIKLWQNVPSGCDAGSDASDEESSSDGDTFVVDSVAETSPDASKDAPTDVADVSDAMETSDGTVGDSGADTGKETSPDSIAFDTFDSGPGDTGTLKDTFGDSVADASDADVAEAPPPKPLKCTTPVRDALFDKVKVYGGDVEDVGRILAFSPSSIYVPVRNGGKATVKHWDGKDAKDWLDEMIPGPPRGAIGIWGTSESNIWLAANEISSGSLRHKTGGVWVIDSTQPASGVLGDITGVSATEMFMVGMDPTFSRIIVWRGYGTSWAELPKLPSSDWFTGVQLFAGGSNRVALSGYDVDSATGKEERAAIYVYDGVSIWTKYQAPLSENFVLAGGIHGTSMDELWIAGRTNGTPYQGKVCKFSKLTTWICYVSSGTTTATKANSFSAVFSPWAGSVVAAGNIDPIGPGVGRIMTIDELTSSPIASSIDLNARSPISVTRTPGTTSYSLDHSGKGGSERGGFYRFTCD